MRKRIASCTVLGGCPVARSTLPMQAQIGRITTTIVTACMNHCRWRSTPQRCSAPAPYAWAQSGTKPRLRPTRRLVPATFATMDPMPAPAIIAGPSCSLPSKKRVNSDGNLAAVLLRHVGQPCSMISCSSLMLPPAASARSCGGESIPASGPFRDRLRNWPVPAYRTMVRTSPHDLELSCAACVDARRALFTLSYSQSGQTL